MFKTSKILKELNNCGFFNTLAYSLNLKFLSIFKAVHYNFGSNHNLFLLFVV